MKEKLVTYEDLSRVTGLSLSTFRTYLGNFRFDKYVKYAQINAHSRKCFLFNKDFLNEISEFLWLRRQARVIKCLQNYYKKEVLKND